MDALVKEMVKELTKESAVSKIDDLGRVLVPKEIREVMGWGVGVRLQIACNPTDGTVTFKHA